MEVAEEWISELANVEVSVMINKIGTKLYTWFESERVRRGNVTTTTLSVVKTVTDFIALKVMEVSRRNVILETKLSERAQYDKLMENLAERISGTTLEEKRELENNELPRKKKMDYAVVVAMSNKDGDIDGVKETVREIYRGNANLPKPDDVLVTKNKQLILKMKNKGDTELAKSALEADSGLKEIVNINIPKRRRKRLMILSVDPDVQEDVVKQGVEKVLTNMDVSGGLSSELKRKLMDTTLDGESRKTLEDLYRGSVMDFDIVRQVKTRMGKVNWMLDVDDEGRKCLLKSKRICIDFNRYRIVDFVSIARCFRCQEFGHYAGQCKNDIRCVKCSEPHHHRDCKAAELKCINCYFADALGDCSHAADNPDCPAYQKYRKTMIPDRS